MALAVPGLWIAAAWPRLGGVRGGHLVLSFALEVQPFLVCHFRVCLRPLLRRSLAHACFARLTSCFTGVPCQLPAFAIVTLHLLAHVLRSVQLVPD